MVFNSLIRQTMGNAGRVSWHLTPLIARAWREAGRVPWHLTRLIAEAMGRLVRVAYSLYPLNMGSWSVAWHLTYNHELWGSRSRSVAFNPLNRQGMEKQVA
ncbi:hypothetical protein [Escherichia coli]|uniref:hypothetical protein n=1 Tax=Escherichia coli TaxID=562 RepID=UPI001118AFD1|nr:hypothetical protein [Escherichia coli]TNK20443.1 hypothetical protein CI672_024375 [Escherichia coli]